MAAAGGGHYLNERSSINLPRLPPRPKVPAETSLISPAQLMGRQRKTALILPCLRINNQTPSARESLSPREVALGGYL